MKIRELCLLLLMFMGFAISCCKSKRGQQSSLESQELAAGILTDLTGLDGCGWVIRLDKKLPDGTDKLEPTNLKAFNIPLKEGQPVLFSYIDFPGGSVCMVGKIVELKSMKTK